MATNDESRTEFGFARSTCDCERCVHWCEHMPGYMIPADLPRMYEATKLPGQSLESWAAAYLRASPGALVQTHRGKITNIPTLVPDTQKNGHCIFLKEGKCVIHKVSPFGCAFFHCQQPDEEWQKLTTEGLNAIIENAEATDYAHIWEYLWNEINKRSGGAWMVLADQ